ncbi:MAG: sensor histidine kinase [Lachnotalea sp.]
MGRLKSQVKASHLFTKYIVLFCAETIMIMLMCLMIFSVLMSKGMIYPADYYENYINDHKLEIETSNNISKIIPQNCEYAIYEKDGTFIEGTIENTDSSKVWAGIQNQTYMIVGMHYEVFQRGTQLCIILYKLQTFYSNVFLQDFLPNPEIVTGIIFVIIFIINVQRLSHKFGKILSNEMDNLNDVTGYIKDENLDFDIKPSKIIEINNVLHSLLKLKDSLKDSLDKQWKLESARREQIAALGHDLKTPLTIVKGNIELLDETNLDKEQKVFVQSSLNNIVDMQLYIQKLLEINATNREMQLNREEINTEDFFGEILSNLDHIARHKKIHIIQENKLIKINADKVLLKRAIVNVLENAIDYSKDNSKIIVKVISNQDNTRIVIEDSGEGFIGEALEMATEQFYRSDKSRNSKFHHGMGLYIAKNIMKLHEGNIVLGRSKELGGAKVELWW